MRVFFIFGEKMTRGEKVIAFIERYCKTPDGAHVGKPIALKKFQRDFILDVYDNPHGTHTAILSIARKNGKSALIAGVMLAHLVGPEARKNAEIVSGALSRDQASIIFKLAVKMIQVSDELSSLTHIVQSKKTIYGLAKKTEYRALSAEGKTTHGLSPVLATMDETGQIKAAQDDFFDAVTTSQGAHEKPLLLIISTQAPSDAALLSKMIDAGLKGDDKGVVCHIYSAPLDADIHEESIWRLANPALGEFRSIEDVRKQSQKAKDMPSFEPSFRNLILNQRVSTFAPFVSKTIWEANGAQPCDFDGLEVFGGLDLSKRTDLTAFVLCARDKDGILHIKSHFFAPHDGLFERAKRDQVPYDVWAKEGFLTLTPGATVDYDHVAEVISDLVSDLNLVEVAFDRWKIDFFKESCSRIGVSLPLTPFGQGFKDMSPAIDALEADLLNRRARHGCHPVLTMCAQNVSVSTDPAGGRKFDKAKSTGRIDGMVALAMAVGIMDAPQEEPQGDINDFLNSPVFR